MVTLARVDGSVLSYSSEFLNGLLASLKAATQNRIYLADGVAVLNAGRGLLLVDVSWSTGLRLAEMFEASADDSFPWGAVLSMDSTQYSITDALSASGYAGQLPPPTLGAVHMAYYDAATSAYVVSPGADASLVVGEGIFGAEPAVLRRLAGIDGVLIVEDGDRLVISAQPTPIDLGPFYALIEGLQSYVDSRCVLRLRDELLGRTRARLGDISTFVCGVNPSDDCQLVNQGDFAIWKGPVPGGASSVVGTRSLLVTNLATTAPKFVASDGAATLTLRPGFVESLSDLQFKVGSSTPILVGVEGVRANFDFEVRRNFTVGVAYNHCLDIFIDDGLGQFGEDEYMAKFRTDKNMTFVVGNDKEALRLFLEGDAELCTKYLINRLNEVVVRLEPFTKKVTLEGDANALGAFSSYGSLSVVSEDVAHLVALGTTGASISLHRNGGERWRQTVETLYDGSFVISRVYGAVITPLLRINYNTPSIELLGDVSVTGGLTVGGSTVSGSAGTGAVRYDASQTLTDSQKAVARANIQAFATAGGSITGDVTCPYLLVAGAGTSTNLTISNIGTGGASRLSLLAVGHNCEIDVGTSGMRLATQTTDPINFQHNTAGSVVTSLTLSAAGVATFGSVPLVGTVALTKTDDSRLSNTRVPTGGSVVDASVATNAAIAQSKIANLTSDLASKVSSSDSRLSDTRVPTANSVTDASIVAGGLSQSSVSGLTTALAAKFPYTGGNLSGGLLATSLDAYATAGSGGNVTINVTNTLQSGFSSLYMTTGGSSTEQGQFYVGQGGGLVVRTNTAHPITFGTGAFGGSPQTHLTMATTGISNFAQTPTAGGTALVKTNDARLADTRAPTAGSVVDASVAAGAAIAQTKIASLVTDLASKLALAGGTMTGALACAALSASGTVSFTGIPTSGGQLLARVGDLANYLGLAGGTMTGALNAYAGLAVRGAKQSNAPATAGIYMGLDGGGNTGVEITATAGKLSYMDWGDVNQDYNFRILNNAGAVSMTGTSLQLNPPVTCTSSLSSQGFSATTGTFSSTVSATRLTASAQPYVVAYRAGALSIPSGFGYTLLALNATLESRGAAVFNSGTSRFTAPAAGVYHFCAQWSLSLAISTVWVELRVNGASKANMQGDVMAAVSATALMAAGDYAEVWVCHGYGSSASVGVSSDLTRVSCALLA